VRAFVGYGGGDLTLAQGYAYFVAQHDQRIYRQPLSGGSARPITPGFGAASSPTVSPDGRWLAYIHTYEDEDCIAIVDTEGRHWPGRLAAGCDFYMQPCWHPAGESLAWVEWDHPNMPWDGTRLKVADIVYPEDGLPVVAAANLVAGDEKTAIFQPLFTPDGSSLIYASDQTGWGQLYRRDLASGVAKPLTNDRTEYARPAWAHGLRNTAVGADGTIYTSRAVEGFDTLVAIDPDGAIRELRDVQGRHSSLTGLNAAPTGHELACIAASGTIPARVVVFDLDHQGYRTSIRRRSAGETTPPESLAVPQAMTWESFDGKQAHGLYYPPAGPNAEPNARAPLIVIVHGGPTSQVTATWSAQAQFFATRGYGVLFPNYRGSTGYGRDYMLKLRNHWGIYDVQDAKFGAEYLAKEGLAQRDRMVIMGGSAGGYTVLQSLIELPGFYKAAICSFGVANMFTLAADTHKFEVRYLDSLLGPLPEASAVYRERSPIFHADKIRDPIAVFQGDIDRVVPREQSDSIVASLRARGVPHEYHVYEGEGHGWRKTETVEAFYSAIQAFLKQYVLFA
jgi:dipeptidyl aminopeptidase/acylaminoacyl peptidase